MSCPRRMPEPAEMYENKNGSTLRADHPEQMKGQPCVRGMRLTVRRVIEWIALYPNRDDLFRNYPEVEPEDIQALAFAAANLADSATQTDAA